MGHEAGRTDDAGGVESHDPRYKIDFLLIISTLFSFVDFSFFSDRNNDV